MAGHDPAVHETQISSRLFSAPSPDYISLNKLESWIDEIDKRFPPDLRLRGVSFDRASNRSFGFKDDGSDFTVSTPSSLLRTGDIADAASVRLEVRNQATNDLTTTQLAFIEVFKKGLELIPADVDTVLIDMATLWPDKEYFSNEYSDGSVMQALDKALQAESIQSKKVVIRLLTGDQGKDLEALQQMCLDLFVRFDVNGRNPVPRLSHPHLKLYAGLYSPDFDPKEDADIKEVKTFVSTVLDSTLLKVANFTGMLKAKDINKMVDDLLSRHVLGTYPAITWNHGKVLAVGGQSLMTGGINYYREYTPTFQHDISDHSVKIQGDAALSAHKWADYFWNYLLKPSGTDRHSVFTAIDLSRGNNIVNFDKPNPTSVTTSDNLMKPMKERTLETLTISRLGDWHGSMKKIQYPVQVIDCLRDVIINLAWHWCNLTGYHIIWGKAFMTLVDYFSDDNLTKEGLFQNLGINPAAWATRYARNQAIHFANDSVVIDQQMMTQCFGGNVDSYKEFAYKANSMITGKPMEKYAMIDEVPWNKPWDGNVWPYDTLIAIAQALGNISKSKKPSSFAKDKFCKESRGVFIILTTDKAKGGSRDDGWQDRITIGEIKRRLKIIMQNLSYASGGIDDDKIDPAIKNYLHFKRTSTSATDKGKDLYNHSKIVVVDRRVMYVGSDNAYPSYNEEHGVWIGDQQTIDKWLGGWLQDFWTICAEPTKTDSSVPK